MIETGLNFADNWAGETEAFCRDSAAPLIHGSFGEPVNKLPVLKSTAPPVPTSVYSYFDKNGILIYVGITSTGITRNRQHNDSKEWWPYVLRQQIQHFPSRQQAHAKEVAIIEKFRPPFNKQHNPDHGVAHRFYLEMLQREPVESTAVTEIISRQRTIELFLRGMDTRNNEVRLTSQYGDDIAGKLWFDKAKPAPVLEGLNHLGSVCLIEHHNQCVTVHVRMRSKATLDRHIYSAIGHLKVVTHFNKPHVGFKRIQLSLEAA